MIIADDREPRERIASVKRLRPCTVARLEGADWTVRRDGGVSLALQVKTVGSLLSALTRGMEDGRPQLYAQLEQLALREEAALFVIIGEAAPDREARLTVNHASLGWSYHAYAGVLLSVSLHGVAVLQLPSEHAFAEAMAAWDSDRKPRLAAVRPKSVFAWSQAQRPPVQLLAQLPLINSTLAGRIWEKYGTARFALASQDWTSVHGIGEERNRAAQEVLDQMHPNVKQA